MSLFNSISLLAVCMGVCLTTPVTGRYLEACGHTSADVVFILDSSGSIYRHDFDRQLRWVGDVIDEFDIGPDRMRVGTVSFSNWAFLEFNLNVFLTKPELKQAITAIPHSKGDTNTAAALTFVKDNMFRTMNGARYDVPHVAIVLTDGESNDPYATAYIAEAARRMGIQIFAIGIGHKVNENELINIASHPPKQFVFRVDDYEALESIKQIVARKACEVTTPKPTTPAPTDPPIVDIACADQVMADVILAVSPSGSDANTETALDFFRELTRGMDVSKDKVQVGLVPKDCRDIPEINLKTFDKKNEALQALDRLTSQEQADMRDVLRYMRKASFSQQHGARPRAKKIAVIIIDETSESLRAAKKEAAKLRKKGVEMFVIGVGKSVRPEILHHLATEPTLSHVFHVTDYSDLHSILSNVKQAICTAPRW